MNGTSSIPPISSLQRYLTEAHDSIVNHLNSEETDDIHASLLHYRRMNKVDNERQTQITTNKQ